MTFLFKRVAATTSAIIIGGSGLLLTAALTVHAQSSAAWKPLFNGKDFSGWTVIGGGRGRAAGPGAPAPATPPTPPAAPSTKPEERGWKVDNGVITSVAPSEGQRSGSLATVDKFKDVELEFDFLLAEAGTKCTPKLDDKQVNLSEDKTCTFNSGVTLRNAYQLNLGRREAGEYIGIVVHRTAPEAIRGNVDWLSSGDCGAKPGYLEDCEKFPMLRKKGDWNHVRIMFKGTHLQAWLNGKQIADVTDDPTDPAEANWKEAAPITFQWPPAGESGGFAGSVKYKNIRVREL